MTTTATQTAPDVDGSKTVFVGRQQIYNRELDVVAYELLFRSGTANAAQINDGDRATSQVLVNSLMDIGLERVVGNRPAYVNCTRPFIVGELPLPYDKDHLVLEVLESIEPDDEVISGIRRLSGQGYTIALDDCVFSGRLRKLVEVADVVKIDFPMLQKETVQHGLEVLRKYPVKLLAEKVETFDDFNFCMEMGFDLFQGYFLSRPQIVEGQTVPNNRLAVLRLIGRLQDPAVGMNEIEDLVEQDVGLSYKLLQYINSAAVGLRRKVESIQQAIVLVGLERIRTMVTLVMLAGIDDKPLDLLETAMLRGKMCESLAEQLGRKDKEMFFTVGMFSTLDAIMDAPMESILNELPLTDTIKDAITRHEGALGQSLQCTLAYEHGEWENVSFLTVPPQRVREAFLMSTSWVVDIRNVFAA